MIDLLRTHKAPLSSQIALPIALLLAGVFGFGISITQPSATHTSAVSPKLEKSLEIADNHLVVGRELEKVQDFTCLPVALQESVDFCSRSVTNERSFVIFKRGTCVIVREPCKNPTTEAINILAKCHETTARFVSEITTDGDVIVAFKAPVFQRFDPSEVKNLRPWLNQFSTALLAPEESVAAGDGWIPPDGAQIGLLARRRLLEDAVNSKPIWIVRAKDRINLLR